MKAVMVVQSAGNATRSVAAHQSVTSAQSAAYPARVLADCAFKGAGELAGSSQVQLQDSVADQGRELPGIHLELSLVELVGGFCSN